MEIKHKHTGKVLLKIEAKTLIKANLSWANLSWANLSGANLSWANLSGANLSWVKGEFKFNFGVKLKVV